MKKDPWTDSDPQPGDFDAELAAIDPDCVEYHAGDPDARLTLMVGIRGEDAERLQRIAKARGKTPADLVAELLRDADSSAA